MKNQRFIHSHILLFTAGILALAFSSRAAIFEGDVIVIDIGQNGTQTSVVGGTWNNIAPVSDQGFDGISTEANPSRTITSDLLRYSDGLGTGVGFDVLTDGDSFHGIGGATVTPDSGLSFGSTGVIPNSAQQDLGYMNNGTVTFTLTGLNNALSYNLQILSKIDVTRNANPWVINSGLPSEQTQSVDPDTSPFIYSFNNIATDGAGNISLKITTPSGGGAVTAHINALELTAIPEPSSVALTLIGFGMAAFGLRGHRRNG